MLICDSFFVYAVLLHILYEKRQQSRIYKRMDIWYNYCKLRRYAYFTVVGGKNGGL